MEELVVLFAWRVVALLLVALVGGFIVGLLVGHRAARRERDAELDREWEELRAERHRLHESWCELGEAACALEEARTAEVGRAA